MVTKYSELIWKLEKLIDFLTENGEKTWSKWFIHVKESIANENFQGIITLTQMSGGMGSFFDLVICKVNGHNIEPSNEIKANRQLEVLSSEVFELAREIRMSS